VEVLVVVVADVVVRAGSDVGVTVGIAIVTTELVGALDGTRPLAAGGADSSSLVHDAAASASVTATSTTARRATTRPYRGPSDGQPHQLAAVQ
jgi:hypothetical protein